MVSGAEPACWWCPGPVFQLAQLRQLLATGGFLLKNRQMAQLRPMGGTKVRVPAEAISEAL